MTSGGFNCMQKSGFAILLFPGCKVPQEETQYFRRKHLLHRYICISENLSKLA